MIRKADDARLPSPRVSGPGLAAIMVLLGLLPMSGLALIGIAVGRDEILSNNIIWFLLASFELFAVPAFGLRTPSRWAVSWFWWEGLVLMIAHPLAVLIALADLFSMTVGGARDRDDMSGLWLIYLALASSALLFILRLLRDAWWRSGGSCHDLTAAGAPS